MKHVILSTALLCISLFSSTLFADVHETPVQNTKGEVCEQLKADGASREVLARRGCCSWHGGVCGCSGGRAVCCDGQFSPTCTCNKDQPVEVPN